MNQQKINDTFTLQIPDSLAPMSSRELEELSRNGGDPCRWGAWDRENHVMMTALWKDYPALLARLADLKAIAKRNEQLTRKAYEKHDYRLLGFDTLQAGETKAMGYRYTYRAGDIRQAVTCWLIKDGRTVYALMCNGREENSAADQAMFRGAMEGLRRL